MGLGRASTTVGLVALLTAAMAGTAGAAPPVRESFTDEFRFVEEDFCDEAGLTVLVEGTVTGRLQITRHGREGLAYFAEHILVETSYSTVDEEGDVIEADAVTEVIRTLSKDLHVVSGPADTLVIEILATGNATVYGSDGKAVGRNPGQIRISLVVDDNGTPEDPDDDVILDETVTKESTGRSDDFCEVAVPELLG